MAPSPLSAPPVQALQHYASQVTKSAISRKQGQLSCFYAFKNGSPEPMPPEPSPLCSPVKPQHPLTQVSSLQGVGPALPFLHFLGWLTGAFPIWASFTVFPRPGAVPALLSAAACKGHDQLTCSHDSPHPPSPTSQLSQLQQVLKSKGPEVERASVRTQSPHRDGRASSPTFFYSGACSPAPPLTGISSTVLSR